MKTKFSRIGKRALSVILAIMMIISTMLVGMVSVSAGVTDCVMKAGDTLYYDFTNLPTDSLTGVNYNSGGNVGDNYNEYGAGNVIPVTLKADMNFSNTTLELFKTERNGWDPAIKSTILPEDGQNTIVVNSDDTYYWSTTKAAKYYYRGGDNSWGTTLMNVSEDGYYEYIKKTSGTTFKIYDGTWYGVSYVNSNFNNTDITLSGDDNITCSQSGSYYILVYYPNTTINNTNNPIICASTTLPDNSDEEPTTTAPITTVPVTTVPITTVAPTDPATLAKPVINCTTSVVSGSTVEVTLSNPTDYIAETEGLAFAYTVTASDGSVVTTTPSSSGKLGEINDTVSFTAGAEGLQYTITVTASATDLDAVTSDSVTVTVKSIKYAQDGRIYAYAKTLAENETPVSDAWVAAEYNAEQQAVFNNEEKTSGANKYPSLGSAASTDLRIFLPTTASNSDVVLYNTSSGDLVVGDVTIKSGKYGTVKYTPNVLQKIKLNDVERNLTIYKSSAEGALYLNNTGDYSSFDESGIPSMLTQLYSDKEEGEISSGNSGAIAEKGGNVTAYEVKKIKGRGNSTWVNTDKKSFNVTFKDNINALGFTTGKKFSLLANFKDPSLSRNQILYALADEMRVKYSPDTAVVDLYMNGLYMGSYLMCQKVEVGKNELINDSGVVNNLFDDLYTDPAGQTTEIQSKGFSFLMELDSNYDSSVDFGTTVNSQNLTIKEPEYDGGDTNVSNAIKAFVQSKYTVLYNALNNNTLTYDELNAIIDVDSLAKYYLINELAKNFDIGVTSTYFVYNKAEGKFYISPVWDMDVTTGNCDKSDDYLNYKGNWTDGNSEYNRVLKLVYNNVHVQSKARSIWTTDYYTKLIKTIDTLGSNAETAVSGSFENNFKKWTYPYGFQGKYKDNVVAKTSLKEATYNVSTHTYSVSTSSTTYADKNREDGQIQYVVDWLKSRVAWMTMKYNTYYITGSIDSWNSAPTMENKVGINTYNKSLSAGTYEFKICSDGGLSTNTENSTPYRDSTATSISYDPDVIFKSDSTKITNLNVTSKNTDFSFTTAEAMTVYFTYDQITNTVTLSDTPTISSGPVVTLAGVLDTDETAIGSNVALTATITAPAKKDNEVVTGDYTVEVIYNGNSIITKDVTVDEDTATATFTFEITDKNTTLSVKAYPKVDTTLVGTSNSLTYYVKGLADNAIYFDPSSDSSWKSAITETSVVTATVGSTSFEMRIDTNDIHGLQKGVFVAYVDDETLEAIKTNGVKFTLGSLSTTASADSSVKNGSIFTYTTESGKTSCWGDYNVEVEESYPTASGATSYQEFVTYLESNRTKNVVYFDNSATQWYNAYVYDWNNGDVCYPMKKLKGFDNIFYYEVTSGTIPSSKFLFKDRSTLTFGTDYQQTVDFVDGFVYYNDTSTQLTINFETSFSKVSNPIFQATGFYNITEQSGSGLYKNRAFANEWKDLNAILKATVKASNVHVYFDLHDNQYDSISLKHSIVSGYTYTALPSETTLTRLGSSTIYSANILLPYVESENKLAFSFDGFVVNGTTYPMSASVQPAYTCINTGEVWYEVNANYKTGLVSVASEDSDYGIATVADTTTYYISGSGTNLNNWGDYGTAMTNNGSYSYIKTSGDTEFKIGIGQTGDNRYTYNSDKISQDSKIAISSSGEEYKNCVIKYSGEYYIYIDHTTNLISASTKLPSSDTGTTTYYLRGEGNGLSWDTGAQMTNSNDGTYSWYKVSGTDDVKFKIGTQDSPYQYYSANIRNTINGVATDVTINSSAQSASDEANCSITYSGTYYIYLFHDTDGSQWITASTQYPPSSGTDPDDPVTNTDYCGILGYNHSTANFSATEGGQIDEAVVMLTNGYYRDDAIETGYTSFDGEKYTVIYALTSTGKTDASTSYSSTTSKKVASSEYTFDDWTKDGVVIEDDSFTVTDSIANAATVNYVANWSEIEKVTYTFTYKYDEFDTKVQYEYTENNTTVNSDYKIQISIAEDASIDAIKEAYLNNVPKLLSDYFVYSFDGVEITVDTTNHKAESKANIAEVREYKVSLIGESSTSVSYHYQKSASFTREAPDGQNTVWKDSKTGAILYVGNTYKFRVTKDTVISYEFADVDTIPQSTYVSDPTYEFYTSGTTERVRFNILVDNFVGDAEVEEFGVLYFFTDSAGKPIDTTISYDAEIDQNKLVDAVNYSSIGGYGGITAKIVTDYNNKYKYIFAPTLANNDTNRFKYLRVYSYFKTKDGNIIISDNSVIASIISAINQS